MALYFDSLYDRWKPSKKVFIDVLRSSHLNIWSYFDLNYLKEFHGFKKNLYGQSISRNLGISTMLANLYGHIIIIYGHIIIIYVLIILYGLIIMIYGLIILKSFICPCFDTKYYYYHLYNSISFTGCIFYGTNAHIYLF